MRTYLDHNATSPLRPAVKARMQAAMDVQGNASSVHAEGRAARKLIDDAREALALKLGCLAQMIVFTSGGTEANNMALRGLAVERRLVSGIEHPSVLSSGTQLVPVDHQGRIDSGALAEMLHGPRALVSIMLANNETGIIQNMRPIAEVIHGAGHLLHVDAVQAFGKIPVNFGLLGCDLLTVAAHKVGGPSGIGALVVRDGLPIAPLLAGGGQELRRRAGTENLIAIAGFAAVAQEPMLDLSDLRDQLEGGLPDATIFSQGAPRLSNTSCFALSGMKAEILLMQYDLGGIAVSSGSACSSGKVARSHVLEAMGVPNQLSTAAVRVSMGWNTNQQHIENFIDVTQKIVARAKQRAA